MKIDWCIFGFHQYRNWVEIKRGPLFTPGDSIPDGSYYVYKTICKNCSKVKLKRINL